MAANSSDPATTEALARILAELNEMKLRNVQLETKVGRKREGGIECIVVPA